jgi:hypothetical protein
MSSSDGSSTCDSLCSTDIDILDHLFRNCHSISSGSDVDAHLNEIFTGKNQSTFQFESSESEISDMSTSSSLSDGDFLKLALYEGQAEKGVKTSFSTSGQRLEWRSDISSCSTSHNSSHSQSPSFSNNPDTSRGECIDDDEYSSSSYKDESTYMSSLSGMHDDARSQASNDSGYEDCNAMSACWLLY